MFPNCLCGVIQDKHGVKLCCLFAVSSRISSVQARCMASSGSMQTKVPYYLWEPHARICWLKGYSGYFGKGHVYLSAHKIGEKTTQLHVFFNDLGRHFFGGSWQPKAWKTWLPEKEVGTWVQLRKQTWIPAVTCLHCCIVFTRTLTSKRGGELPVWSYFKLSST